MKRDRSGHQASDDRRGTEMHQHIASRADDDCRVHLQPLRGGNRTCRPQTRCSGALSISSNRAQVRIDAAEHRQTRCYEDGEVSRPTPIGDQAVAFRRVAAAQ
jgi:hypothetical protein